MKDLSALDVIRYIICEYEKTNLNINKAKLFLSICAFYNLKNEGYNIIDKFFGYDVVISNDVDYVEIRE